MSHYDLLYKRLDRGQVRKYLARFISLYSQGKAVLHLTDHFRKRCLDRSVSVNDAINVMKAGLILKEGESDIRTGQFVYNVETKSMEVAFQFLDETRIRLITIKRK